VLPKYMRLNRELLIFLLVGAVATIADFSVYFSLTSFEIDKNFSKVVSFVVGTWIGYLGNSRITFSQRSGNIAIYFMVYAFSLVINVWINNIGYSTSSDARVSWLLATFSSTAINFIGLRYFAFSNKV